MRNYTPKRKNALIWPFFCKTWRVSPLYRRAILRYYSTPGRIEKDSNSRAGKILIVAHFQTRAKISENGKLQGVQLWDKTTTAAPVFALSPLGQKRKTATGGVLAVPMRGRNTLRGRRAGGCFLIARDNPAHPQSPQFFTRGAIFPVWAFCGWFF